MGMSRVRKREECGTRTARLTPFQTATTSAGRSSAVWVCLPTALVPAHELREVMAAGDKALKVSGEVDIDGMHTGGHMARRRWNYISDLTEATCRVPRVVSVEFPVAFSKD